MIHASNGRDVFDLSESEAVTINVMAETLPKRDQKLDCFQLTCRLCILK